MQLLSKKREHSTSKAFISLVVVMSAKAYDVSSLIKAYMTFCLHFPNYDAEALIAQ